MVTLASKITFLYIELMISRLLSIEKNNNFEMISSQHGFISVFGIINDQNCDEIQINHPQITFRLHPLSIIQQTLLQVDRRLDRAK